MEFSKPKSNNIGLEKEHSKLVCKNMTNFSKIIIYLSPNLKQKKNNSSHTNELLSNKNLCILPQFKSMTKQLQDKKH